MFIFIFLLILMGIGDWGLGIGDWGLGVGANPPSPIPNPQSPTPTKKFFFLFKINFLLYHYFLGILILFHEDPKSKQ